MEFQYQVEKLPEWIFLRHKDFNIGLQEARNLFVLLLTTAIGSTGIMMSSASYIFIECEDS